MKKILTSLFLTLITATPALAHKFPIKHGLAEHIAYYISITVLTVSVVVIAILFLRKKFGKNKKDH